MAESVDMEVKLFSEEEEEEEARESEGNIGEGIASAW